MQLFNNLNSTDDIKVYSFVGPSGTGKSYRAQMVASERNIEFIIDDGLLINNNQVVAGESAKKAPTKIETVKHALFYKEEEKQEITKALKKYKPQSILILGTSDGMVDKIAANLGLPEISERVYITDVATEQEMQTARKIRAKMSNMGLNETLSYILINDKDVHKFTTDEFEEVRLLDPITEDRNTLSYSIIPSLYKIYEYNKARENKDVCLFEIGKGFWKKGEEYGENQKICVLMTGKYYLGVGNSANVDFYVIKGVVEELLNFLGYENRYTIEMPDQIPNEFHKGQTANINVNGQIVGIVGKLHPEVTKDDVYVMEINLDELLSKRVGKMKYKEISKFPNENKDVAYEMKKDIPSVEVEKVIKKAGGKLLTNIEVFDVYTGENIGKDEKSVAYSLTFNDSKKTLTEEEITKIFENIIANVEKLNDVFLRK